MGRNKAALRIGRRTLLSIVRDNARRLHLPVRVIRRDLVPRCGPLGGIYTALKTARAQRVLFLACDMPFVPETLLSLLLKQSRKKAVFASAGKRPGFPFVLHRPHLPTVEAQMACGEFSIAALCQAAGARVLHVRASSKESLMNLNTPEDWEMARRRRVTS
jgi:molybdenum cofactor guanylyltransferase